MLGRLFVFCRARKILVTSSNQINRLSIIYKVCFIEINSYHRCIYSAERVSFSSNIYECTIKILFFFVLGHQSSKKYKRVSITPFNGPHIIDQINVFDCWHVIKTFRLTDGRWRNAHVWRKLIIGTWLLKAISTFVKCN